MNHFSHLICVSRGIILSKTCFQENILSTESHISPVRINHFHLYKLTSLLGPFISNSNFSLYYQENIRNNKPSNPIINLLLFGILMYTQGAIEVIIQIWCSTMQNVFAPLPENILYIGYMVKLQTQNLITTRFFFLNLIYVNNFQLKRKVFYTWYFPIQ